MENPLLTSWTAIWLKVSSSFIPTSTFTFGRIDLRKVETLISSAIKLNSSLIVLSIRVTLVLNNPRRLKPLSLQQ